MTGAAALPAGDRRQWQIAATVALAAHVSAAALVLSWTRPVAPREPEPVVLVELPPPAAAAPGAASPQAVARPQRATPPVPAPRPPVEAPPVAAPLPRDPVALPPPAAAPVARSETPAPATATASPLAVAPAATGTGTTTTPGNDPRARRQEADYFAMVSAHLNRRKVYPAEARRARQQGVVTVRFTVDRQGGVTAVSIKRGSGHEVLDRATLDLVRRVVPLPPMPPSMPRDSLTLSLPIDYSLRTS